MSAPGPLNHGPSRRTEGISVLASQLGVSEQEVPSILEEMWGGDMAAEALLSAAPAWQGNVLSWRDRSLIVVSSLVTQGGVDARLRGHLRFAHTNGASRAELEQLVGMLAVYVGYPKATTAMEILRELPRDESEE